MKYIGKAITYYVYTVVVLFCVAGTVEAQQYETIATRPSRRQVAVQASYAQAQREREGAREWAQARGMPVRLDDGRTVVELVALRHGVPIYLSTRNVNAAISTSADRVRHTAPFDASGQNLKAGVWDGGSIRATHQEFDGRVVVVDGSANGNHATHVGGTIGATGVVAQALGMAPKVHIDSYDWKDDIAEMLAVAAALPQEGGKIPLSNHSYGTIAGWTYMTQGNSWSGKAGWHWPPWMDWGSSLYDPRYGQYDAGATNYDHVVYMAPYYLPFVAAGNDRTDNPSPGSSIHYYHQQGPVVWKWSTSSYDSLQHPLGDGVYESGFDTLSAEVTAKNIMTVGAVADAVSGWERDVSSAGILSFSSWGPSDDGRIKPDIVANGYELYSTQAGSDSAYAQDGWSGTSMATPNASGSAALLVDYFDNRFPDDAMRASTLKGLIIHTADDLGNPGPDYSYGWGLMNTLAAAELIRDYADGNIFRMTEAVLDAATNSIHTYTLFSDGIEPLRVTLCWTDPPGPEQTTHDSRTSVLVNDLDLKLDGSDTTYFPYKLDYDNPGSNATANSENNVDNVEQVYITAPSAGVYTITVDYDGSLMYGEQHYSLLISGASFDSDGDGIPDLSEKLYFGSITGAVATADSDGDGKDNLAEYISGFDPTNELSVFKIMNFSIPATNGAPFIITWDPVAGRIYNVGWSDSLSGTAFSNLAEDLSYPQNSYTDTVDRIGNSGFYKIDVRLDL